MWGAGVVVDAGGVRKAWKQNKIKLLAISQGSGFNWIGANGSQDFKLFDQLSRVNGSDRLKEIIESDSISEYF